MSTLGSGACRMSMRARPSVSNARVMAAGAMRSARSTALARSCSERRAGGSPIAVRKASRSPASAISPMVRGSRPLPMASPTAESAAARSPSATAARTASVEASRSAVPPPATTRSRAVRVSRTEPPPAATAWSMASLSASSPASATTYRRWSDMMSEEISPSSKTWQRLRMVCTTLWGSVVASTQVTWAGGSSRVLSSAFSAPAVSMCTSSSRYTLARPGDARLTRSSSDRMSSTLLLEAASSSWRSKDRPCWIERQDSQTQQGSPSSLRSVQFSALASTRAVEVLPLPRGPCSR